MATVQRFRGSHVRLRHGLKGIKGEPTSPSDPKTFSFVEGGPARGKVTKTFIKAGEQCQGKLLSRCTLKRQLTSVLAVTLLVGAMSLPTRPCRREGPECQARKLSARRINRTPVGKPIPPTPNWLKKLPHHRCWPKRVRW